MKAMICIITICAVAMTSMMYLEYADREAAKPSEFEKATQRVDEAMRRVEESKRRLGIK